MQTLMMLQELANVSSFTFFICLNYINFCLIICTTDKLIIREGRLGMLTYYAFLKRLQEWQTDFIFTLNLGKFRTSLGLKF